MPSLPAPKLTDLLIALCDAGIEFVLVGGLAAVSQGIPRTTIDVDIVHARTRPNCEALASFLAAHQAWYRGQPAERKLRPDAQALQGPGHHLLITDQGFLDLLGHIEDEQAYEDLVPHSVTIDIAGRRVRILDLHAMRKMKANSQHPKDLELCALIDSLEKESR